MDIFKEVDKQENVNCAKRIRAIRKAFHMTQKEIGQIIHVSQRTVSAYELEVIRIPIEALIILAEYFDIDMNYICGLSKKRSAFPR